MTDIAQARLPALRWGPGKIAIAALGITWIALAAFWAVPTHLGPDGIIYQAMIDAFARDGSLFVLNGYPEYHARALGLGMMRLTPAGLAPQYPGGWGILAAPAYMAGGVRGVIVLNAAASALTLPMIWLAARALLEDRHVATSAALIYGLASFAIDYTFGFSPHAVTTFLVAAAIAAAARGWREGGAATLGGAFLAGLALGVGLNIRVGALIIAAPIAVWLLGAARRPYAATAMLLLGLAPGLAAATAINYAKFGVLSPVSYGGGGGATSLDFYAKLLPLAAAAALGSLALGLAPVRAALYRPRGLALAALAIGTVVIVLPPTRELLARIASGAWVLVVDFQAIGLPGWGLTAAPDGTIIAFGSVKKALLQSLPYAAALPVLLPALLRGPRRAELAFCLLVVVLVITPFAYGTWHGGASKNMRYFLNLLPALAILAAAALEQVNELARPHTSPIAAVAASIGVIGGAFVYGFLRGYSLGFVLEVTLADAVMLGAAVLSGAVLIARGAAQTAAASALRATMLLGLVVAFYSGWILDLRVTQHQRASNLAVRTAAADLPRDALVVSYTIEFLPFRLNRPPALTAEADVRNLTVSPALAALIRRAFAEGRPVIAQSRYLADQLVRMGLASGFQPRYGLPPLTAFNDMRPPGATGGGQG